MKTHEKQASVIAKAVYDRKFAIPEWMFKFVNIDVIEELLPMLSSDDILERYLKEEPVRNFFDTVRESLNIGGISADMIYATANGIYAPFLLKDKGWFRVRSTIRLECKSDDSKNKFINLVANYLLADVSLFEIAIDILLVVGLKKDYIIEQVNEVLRMQHPRHVRHERMELLTHVLGIYENYQLTEKCLDLGIPVFFENGDITDLHRYLSSVVETKWKCDLDDTIDGVGITSEDTEILNKMKYIFKYLNASIIIYAKKMMSDELFNDTFFGGDCDVTSILGERNRTSNGPTYGILSFTDLIDVFGRNQYGLAIWLQLGFIANGGNIKTMFKDDELLPEASIIKSEDQLNQLLHYLTIEDIRFLLYNSTDFVKNIITCRDVKQESLIKILKAIFEYPVNTNLWEALNHKTLTDTIDFREAIIRRIIAFITLDGVFLNVPESMLYMAPSALFVTRNLNKNNIPFIPIDKLIPYLPSIIAQNEYVPFNRFCNGVYVSLSRAVTMDVIIKNITKYEKFGYIGDIDDVDHKSLIDTICKEI